MTQIEQTKKVVTETSVFLSVEGEIGKHLNALYQKIWCEACYDANTEDTKEYAATLLPHIKELNKILKFKS